MTTVIPQGMPPNNVPVIDDNGLMNLAWYRFFNSLHIKSGLGAFVTGPVSGGANRIGVVESGGRVVSMVAYRGGPNASTAIATDINLYLNVYDVTTGQLRGRIKFTDEFP